MALFPLSMVTASKGNPASITDSAVSAIMAYGGLLGAILNVRINLGSITDMDYRNTMEKKLIQLEDQGKEELDLVLRKADEIIAAQLRK